MKHIILISSFFVIFAFADIKSSLYHLYQDKQYEEACKEGLKVFQEYRKDEEFVSLYAFSCLNADYINRLLIPMSILKLTSESRENSAYFATITMQKKLLGLLLWPRAHTLSYGCNILSSAKFKCKFVNLLIGLSIF